MKNTPTVFSKIRSPEDLVLYLDDSTKRLENSLYLHHYTTISKAIQIIKSRTWHLGNARFMNDLLELKNGHPSRWHNLFFSCFMCEDKESIGMWSMYAQPWGTGVKITIPTRIVKAWIRETTELLEVSTKNYMATGRTIPVYKQSTFLWLSSVAYSNAESLQDSKQQEILSWSNQKNENMSGATHFSQLTGYVKDSAWSYEKELRIKAQINNRDNIQRLAISLPDKVIDAMTITASPLFEGDLLQMLSREIPININTERSLFTNKLNILNICEDCTYKKAKNF